MGKLKMVLAYHSIGRIAFDKDEVGAGLYSVPEKDFEEQIKYLSICNPEAIVTFDDGYKDNYVFAYPTLKKYGFKAYFFIIGEKIGSAGYMNQDEIKELKRSGMIIGSHGMTHRILTELNDTELDYELMESKKILEKILEQPIEYFSVPRGFYNQKIINIAKKAGYKAVFTSNIKDRDDFKFGRLSVKANWDLEHFIEMVNGNFSVVYKTQEFIINSAKKFLGAKKYDVIRTHLLKGK